MYQFFCYVTDRSWWPERVLDQWTHRKGKLSAKSFQVSAVKCKQSTYLIMQGRSTKVLDVEPPQILYLLE